MRAIKADAYASFFLVYFMHASIVECRMRDAPELQRSSTV